VDVSWDFSWLPNSSWTAGDWIWFSVSTGISVAVAVASYRRSRHLSRYSIPRAVVIAILAGIFDFLWLILWWINRKRIAQAWKYWREEQAAPA